MGTLAVLGARVALGIVFAGTLVFQVFLVPMLALDLSEGEDSAFSDLQLPGLAWLFLVLLLLGSACAQVVMVCLWRLLTMVRRGTVFSSGAFTYVDVIIGALVTASLIVFGIACTLAPGEGVSPGIVLLICIASAAVGLTALLVFVLRMLLAQAVARDLEADQLKAELDEVI